MERHSFRIVSGESPEIMRKLCLTKFLLMKLGEITAFYAVHVGLFDLKTTLLPNDELKELSLSLSIWYRKWSFLEAVAKLSTLLLTITLFLPMMPSLQGVYWKRLVHTTFFLKYRWKWFFWLFWDFIWSRNSLSNKSLTKFSSNILDFAWLKFFIILVRAFSLRWYKIRLFVCSIKKTVSTVNSAPSWSAAAAVLRAYHNFDRGPMNSIFFLCVFLKVVSNFYKLAFDCFSSECESRTRQPFNIRFFISLRSRGTKTY